MFSRATHPQDELPPGLREHGQGNIEASTPTAAGIHAAWCAARWENSHEGFQKHRALALPLSPGDKREATHIPGGSDIPPL